MTTEALRSIWPRIESVWPTSLLLSLLLLAGYRVLESFGFMVLIAVVGFGHLLVCMRFAPCPSTRLVLSQSLVAITTVGAVVLHVLHVVGPPPSNWWSMVISFAAAEVKALPSYLYFAAYVLVFSLAVAGLLYSARVLELQSKITPRLALSTAYAASAVNLAFDYARSRPLYQVSAESDADAFFFAAGLFGLEFSLTLHVILLLACEAVLLLPVPAPDRPSPS